jgi:phosphohistidine phosphatase
MKKLTLIRHAKSDWHSAAATDFDRPLNKRGKKAAPLMGQRLSTRDCSPDRLISSPAKRARQTAMLIAQEIDYPEEQIEFCEAIYEASLRRLISVVQNLDDDDSNVILFGHNPGFSELGQWLSPDATDWLPTCGLLEFELPVDSWSLARENCATILLYDYPKKDL